MYSTGFAETVQDDNGRIALVIGVPSNRRGVAMFMGRKREDSPKVSKVGWTEEI